MTGRRLLWLLLAPLVGLALITFPLFLIGGPGTDAEQARLCRQLLPALFPEAGGIEIIDAERGTGSSVHVSFRVGGEARDHLISCRFGGIGYSAAKRDLVSVTLDGSGLGEASLYFLKDVWLSTQDSIVADPGMKRTRAGYFQLRRVQAVALQHLIGGLPRLGILALLALATALIYGLLGRINLAFGEFAAMGGIAASLIVAIMAILGADHVAVAAFMALGGGIILGAGYGAVTGHTVLAPLAMRANSVTAREEAGGQPLLVAGVGLLIAVQEGLRLAQGSGTRWLPPVEGEGFVLAAAPGFEVIAHPRLLAMAAIDWAAILGVLYLMFRTRFGRAWRASADDPLAASLCGIDPRRLLVATSALATALAALAGATIALNYGGMHFSGGTMLGLTALIAAILGGIGSLGGAVLGALVIGLFQITWSALHDIAHWELATFTLLTLALILKPGGFFGFSDGAHRKA